MFFWKNRSYFFFACLQKLQVWKKSDTEILQLQKKLFSKTVIVSFMIWNPGKSDSFKVQVFLWQIKNLSFSIKIDELQVKLSKLVAWLTGQSMQLIYCLMYVSLKYAQLRLLT